MRWFKWPVQLSARQALDGIRGLPRQPLFWISGLLLLIAIAIQIQNPPFRQSIENIAFDRFQRWRPRPYPAHLPLRVVAVDEVSLGVLGQWPWPRHWTAEILDRLFGMGAAVVVFDMVFAEPDRTSPQWLLNLWPDQPGLEKAINGLPDHDLVLAQAISRGTAVTGFSIDPGGSGPPPAGARVRFLEPDGPVAGHLPAYAGAVSGLTLLDEAARGVGVLTQDTRETDGLLRRFGVLFQSDGILFPSLALEAVRLFKRQEAVSIHLQPRSAGSGWIAGRGIRGIRLGADFRPLSSQGRLWSHFRPFQADRYISVLDLIQEQTPRDRIDGHIVFIGITAQGVESHVATPLGGQVPSVELHVQLAEQLLDGDHLLRPVWGTLLSGLFLVVAWLGLLSLLWTRRPLFGTLWGGVLCGGFVLFGWERFVNARLLIDPLYPLGVVALLHLTLMIARYLESERQRRLVAARSAFLTHVSHEIRTPLNAVIGLTRLCLGTRLDARQQDYLIKVQAAGEHLLGIINDILDFSKMDAGIGNGNA